MPPPPDNDDILSEILIRLPTESLIRCRAVCKRWRAVIDEPPFVRAHQHLPINKSIFVIQPEHSTTGTYYSLDLEALNFSSNGPQTIPATPLDSSSRSAVVGACKGLVLTEKPLEIWNPLTNERLDLRLDLSTGQVAAAFGLGYDYVTDDYKAVSIMWAKPHRTDVYSLKSDSWRTITNCPREPEGRGVFVCGALNWISSRAGFYYGEEENNRIVALDVGTEKYTLLQMPRPRREYQFLGLDTMLDVLDVWVMKDYGDEGSWVLLFSIEQLGTNDGFLRLVGFIMKLEEEEMRLRVFVEEDIEDYFLFDVKTNTRKRVLIRGRATLFAQEMFPGTKFGLRDNCGGARPKTSSTTSSVMSNKNCRRKFVFFLQDIANNRRRAWWLFSRN